MAKKRGRHCIALGLGTGCFWNDTEMLTEDHRQAVGCISRSLARKVG